MIRFRLLLELGSVWHLRTEVPTDCLVGGTIEIDETNDSTTTVSDLDRKRGKHHDKRDDFTFSVLTSFFF